MSPGKTAHIFIETLSQNYLTADDDIIDIHRTRRMRDLWQPRNSHLNVSIVFSFTLIPSETSVKSNVLFYTKPKTKIYTKTSI